MSGEGSLFERLRAADIRENLQAGKDPAEVARSVCRNLERVFNNWRGSVPIEDSYGLPDDAFAGDHRQTVSHRVAGLLKGNVMLYEPRLKEVMVQAGTEDPSDVYAWEFLLQGRLITADKRPRAIFNVRRRKNRFEVSF
jgi:type VI secretion system lysozyme-like protein